MSEKMKKIAFVLDPEHYEEKPYEPMDMYQILDWIADNVIEYSKHNVTTFLAEYAPTWIADFFGEDVLGELKKDITNRITSGRARQEEDTSNLELLMLAISVNCYIKDIEKDKEIIEVDGWCLRSIDSPYNKMVEMCKKFDDLQVGWILPEVKLDESEKMKQMRKTLREIAQDAENMTVTAL